MVCQEKNIILEIISAKPCQIVYGFLRLRDEFAEELGAKKYQRLFYLEKISRRTTNRAG